jgi:uncharacterized membrane protein affecting hemolysin expression
MFAYKRIVPYIGPEIGIGSELGYIINRVEEYSSLTELFKALIVRRYFNLAKKLANQANFDLSKLMSTESKARMERIRKELAEMDKNDPMPDKSNFEEWCA